MRWHASIFLFSLGLAAALASGCAADPPPDETTADGLVRVPSRSVGGVYRAPDATFIQYQRLILEPPSISFAKDWTENHPEVSPSGIAAHPCGIGSYCFATSSRASSSNADPYKFADEPAPDVLLVVPAIEELDIMVAGSRGLRPVTAPI